MKYTIFSILFLLASIRFCPQSMAQTGSNEEIETLTKQVTELKSKLKDIESEVSSVRSEIDDYVVVFFLFGIVCALWAQNTQRNPWLWFFLGLFFHGITGLVLLAKNSSDKRRRKLV